MTRPSAAGERFDAAYFARYYRNPKTRVSSKRDAERLAGFLVGYLAFLQQPVRRILELGPGVGQLRDALGARLPGARYTGVEFSEYLCARHGYTRGSVETYQARTPFDLVVCQGVLQYLPDAAADRALANLALLTRGALYLEALTLEDWQRNVDRQRTDGAVHLRSVRWYRRRLARTFTSAGGGLFLPRDSGAVLFELEKPR
jgi:trans-aconitate methyltransferase